jgi:hypothetical protein
MIIKSNKALLKAVNQLRSVLTDLTLTTDERFSVLEAFNALINQSTKGK